MSAWQRRRYASGRSGRLEGRFSGPEVEPEALPFESLYEDLLFALCVGAPAREVGRLCDRIYRAHRDYVEGIIRRACEGDGAAQAVLFPLVWAEASRVAAWRRYTEQLSDLDDVVQAVNLAVLKRVCCGRRPLQLTGVDSLQRYVGKVVERAYGRARATMPVLTGGSGDPPPRESRYRDPTVDGAIYDELESRVWGDALTMLDAGASQQKVMKMIRASYR